MGLEFGVDWLQAAALNLLSINVTLYYNLLGLKLPECVSAGNCF